jgi:MioC protein
MSSRIGVFVATMTGTAEMCAEEIVGALSSLGFDCDVLLMDGQSADALTGYDRVVVVSSTYGHGDIPDNGQAFFQSVEAADSLVGVRYAVFGLGDMTYATTFCEAAQKWDALFADKGASRYAPTVLHDAASGTLAEDVAGNWAAEWAGELEEAA